MFNSYFIGKEVDMDSLMDFLIGLNRRHEVRQLDNGYELIGAKLNFIDKLTYKLMFGEKKVAWSRLKTI